MAGQDVPPLEKEPENMSNEPEENVALDPMIQDALGKALRAYSEDIVKAPIPDKFLLLLAQLEAKEREQK